MASGYTGPWIPITITWDGGTPNAGSIDLSGLLPMPPWDGPPLPTFLGIYWPWYKPTPA